MSHAEHKYSRSPDIQPMSHANLEMGECWSTYQWMVDERGYTGGCEGQLLLFAAFHGAQQEANTLFRGGRLPGIETVGAAMFHSRKRFAFYSLRGKPAVEK